MKGFILFIIMVFLTLNGFSKDDPRKILSSPTPTLDSPTQAMLNKNPNTLQLEVLDQKLREEDFKSSFSFGTKESGFKVKVNQSVLLEIKITNLSKEATKPLKVVYEIYGTLSNAANLSFVRESDKFVQDIGEFEINDPIQFMSSRSFHTQPVQFAYPRLLKKTERGDDFWTKGTKFAGYRVFLYEDGKKLVDCKEK